MRAAPVVALVALALGAAPRVAGAQQRPDTLDCADCEPRVRRPLVGAGQMFGAWAVPWSVNMFVRKAEFAHVTPRTWWDNITGDWVWDDNSFGTNQFAHPYHGNLYFNSFRANGFGFWGASAAAWAGAYIWECCGEKHPGAPNDLINTAMGGMALGEMFYRLSGLLIDNRATGGRRLRHELGALALNPQRGFNRLFGGRWNDVGPNPPDARPDWLQGTLDLGSTRFDDRYTSDPPTGEDAGVLRLGLTYGNPLTSVPGKPFAYFQVNGDILLRPAPGILQLATRGSLWGRRLGGASLRAQHLLGVYLNYDYLNHETTEFGMQSVTAGVLSQWLLSSRAMLTTEVLGRGIAIAGVRTPDYIVSGEGRDYDYGPGAGTRLDATLLVNGMGQVKAGYGFSWVRTLNGAGANHYIHRAEAELRTEVSDHLGLGVSWKYWEFHTNYVGQGAEIQKSRQWSFFTTAALPRWNY